MNFCYFVIISSWKIFIWIKQPRVHCANLVEIGPMVLEKMIFKFCQYIFAISLLSPLGKGWRPSFEQTEIPFTKRWFVLSLVEIGPVVLEKKIFKIYQCIFHNYHLLEKRVALHLNKLESPSPKDALFQVWLKLAQWFWIRRWKCEKFTDRQTRQTDGQSTDKKMIRKNHLSFQLRLADRVSFGILLKQYMYINKCTK